MLSPQQINDFIELGYIKVENAFSKSLAKECCDILWAKTGFDKFDHRTWNSPVVRIGDLTDDCFVDAANSPKILKTLNTIAGDNWIPRKSLGTFPLRFPHSEEPKDTGWHVDASFPGDDPNDFMSWRINVASQGRALLMLFLFSDVSENDAPTRLAVGSHKDVARLLHPHRREGLTFMELAAQLESTDLSREAIATGPAGTVYLCHPFLAHAAQPHRGIHPRFMAQPPLLSQRPFKVDRKSEASNLIEKAIISALSEV